MSTTIIASDIVFNKTERQVIAAIAEATITEDASRNLPAASDPQVLAIILKKAAHLETRLKAGIELLQSEIDPLAASPLALLKKLGEDGRLRSFSRMITIVILQSYYQDPRVLEALKLAARPPFPLGHEVEAGDWSLLEPVKKRGSFYRPA
ncbi:MAG: hypothetical protein AAF512_00990 [Pseudomonadota bacterium]